MGTNDGFCVYVSDPLKCYIERTMLGDIQIAEVLFKTNIVALVGGPQNRNMPETKVIIWDEY